MLSRSLTIVCVASTGLLAFGSWPRDGGMSNQGDWVVAGMGGAATLTPPPIVDPPTTTVHRTVGAATSWFAWTLTDGMVGPAHADDEENSPTSETIPRFSKVVMDPQSGAVFEGTGRPGTSVVLWKQGWVIGRADVSQNGRWAVRLDEPFKEGDHEVTVATRRDNSAKVVYGQEVRIAIPRDFRNGPPVTYELREETPRVTQSDKARSDQDSDNNIGISEALRRRAEDLAQAAHNRFNEITSEDKTRPREKVDADTQNRRVVQQTTPGPTTIPVPERKGPADGSADDDTLLTPVVNWLKRAARDYQTTIVPGLSEPARRPGVLVAGDDPDSEDAEVVTNTGDRGLPDRDADEQRRLDREADELRRRRLARKSEPVERPRETSEPAQAPRDEFSDEQQRLDAEAEAIRRRRDQAAERNRLAALRERAAQEGEDRRRAEALRKQLEERERLAAQEAARLEAERRQKLAEREEQQRRERERQLEDERLKKLARQEEADRRAREAKARAERKAAEERRRAEKRVEEQRRRAEVDAKARRGSEIARLDDEFRSRPTRAQDDRRTDAGRSVTKPPLPETERKTRKERPVFVRRSGRSGVLAPTKVRVPERAPYRVGYNKPRKSKSARVAGARYRYDNDEPSHQKRCHRRAGVKVRRLPGTYIVARGDTLWAIARRHYRRGYRYPIIYRANRRKIRDPDLIYPCQRFYLPKRKRR